jgi:toxin-antitoxin system PIN domain toxin
MPLFLDAKVWLPLVWEGHAASASTRQWAESQSDDFVMCRITQLALLRHLTNPAILGSDRLTNADAGQVIEATLADPAVEFRAEPGGIELVFPRLGEANIPSRNRWTDAYLAAFAITANFELITYDRGFTQFESEGLRWTLLQL